MCSVLNIMIAFQIPTQKLLRRKRIVYIIIYIVTLLWLTIYLVCDYFGTTPTVEIQGQYLAWKSTLNTEVKTEIFYDEPINDETYNRTSIEHFINENTRLEVNYTDMFNVYHYKFDLITKLEDKCHKNDETLDLVFLVLSFLERRDFRDAFRQTWGAEDRFRVRTVFLMGVDSRNASVREGILQENAMYQDIVLADYEDTYHNNSIKYIMGLDWAARFCSHSKFYILADDDSYFNVRKLLKYLASQLVPNDLVNQYPIIYGDFQKEELSKRAAKRKIRFFGGILMSPAYAKRSGKFEISLQEFPYREYMPFVNGHATIMSRDVIDELLEAAKHTKFIWLDDVYFGFLVAWAGIPITNIPGIVYEHPKESGNETFDKYISTHYMPSPEEMIKTWKIQIERGNA